MFGWWFRARPKVVVALHGGAMRLSKNFTLGEMTRSATARRRGIANDPGKDEVQALRVLCQHVLQPARNALGALTVTSGYRSRKLNKALKGAKRSHHMRGMAADIVPTGGVSVHKLGKWLQNNTKYTQLIYEFGEWIHVSYDPEDLRREVLEAYKDEKGRTKYRTFKFT